MTRERDTRDTRRWVTEDGATAVEYGLVSAGVGLVFVLAGPELYAVFLSLLDAILDGMVG